MGGGGWQKEYSLYAYDDVIPDPPLEISGSAPEYSSPLAVNMYSMYDVFDISLWNSQGCNLLWSKEICLNFTNKLFKGNVQHQILINHKCESILYYNRENMTVNALV